jgi:glutamate-ammonia-ligase adenylyltransferase
LRVDILDMRRRMAQQYRTDDVWDLKHCRGGQVDIDFISQYLVLKHAVDFPDIIAGDPVIALAQAHLLGLIDPITGDRLIFAARLWHRLQQVIRLVVGGKLEEEKLGPTARKHMAQITGEPDFGALKALVMEQEATVFACFEAIFEIEPTND